METLSRNSLGTQDWVLRIEGKEDIPILGTIYIGRDLEADICIPDDRVSRRHARIQVSAEGVIVEDLRSSNGTRVNGQLISSPVKLKSGDKIKLHVLEFSLVDVAVKAKDILQLRASGRADIPLKGQLIVGRDASCALCIDDPRISREHACFSLSTSGVVLRDLNSINGTYVNGTKLEQKTLIKAGDRISFHNHEFLVIPSLDPDATRICRTEPEFDETRFDRVLVGGEALASSREFDEPIIVRKSNQGDCRPADYLNENKRPSAIQKQMQGNALSVKDSIEDLKLGMWLAFEGSHGKTKNYCLISSGEPEKQVYSFAKTSGWGLVKKTREQLEIGFREGHIRILKESPQNDKVPVIFGGRLSRFF